jgi:rubredoxin
MSSASTEAVLWVCNACGYIYDPADGDPEQNIPAGIIFEDLPAGWICPVCGAPSSEFTVENPES